MYSVRVQRASKPAIELFVVSILKHVFSRASTFSLSLVTIPLSVIWRLTFFSMWRLQNICGTAGNADFRAATRLFLNWTKDQVLIFKKLRSDVGSWQCLTAGRLNFSRRNVTLLTPKKSEFLMFLCDVPSRQIRPTMV